MFLDIENIVEDKMRLAKANENKKLNEVIIDK